MRRHSSRVALDAQDEEDLLWIREEFFAARDCRIRSSSGIRRIASAAQTPYHLGLDTGLVYGNKLSCLDVEARRLLQVARGSRRAVIRDVQPLFTAASL